jgi:hypothetical protein
VSNPRPNRAAKLITEQSERWHEPEFLETSAADDLADGFVREDRRNLIGVPVVARSTYIEQQKLRSDLGHGPHRLRIDEVIGTRGDR